MDVNTTTNRSGIIFVVMEAIVNGVFDLWVFLDYIAYLNPNPKGGITLSITRIKHVHCLGVTDLSTNQQTWVDIEVAESCWSWKARTALYELWLSCYSPISPVPVIYRAVSAIFQRTDRALSCLRSSRVKSRLLRASLRDVKPTIWDYSRASISAPPIEDSLYVLLFGCWVNGIDGSYSPNN